MFITLFGESNTEPWSYWDVHFISTLTQPFFGNGRNYLQLQIFLQIRHYIFSVCVFFFELLSQQMNEYEICLQINRRFLRQSKKKRWSRVMNRVWGQPCELFRPGARKVVETDPAGFQVWLCLYPLRWRCWQYTGERVRPETVSKSCPGNS